MISHKFSVLSNGRIAEFMRGSCEEVASDDLLDSVESLSDLWLLANIKETYEKDIEDDSEAGLFAAGVGGDHSLGGGSIFGSADAPAIVIGLGEQLDRSWGDPRRQRYPISGFHVEISRFHRHKDACELPGHKGGHSVVDQFSDFEIFERGCGLHPFFRSRSAND